MPHKFSAWTLRARLRGIHWYRRWQIHNEGRRNGIYHWRRRGRRNTLALRGHAPPGPVAMVVRPRKPILRLITVSPGSSCAGRYRGSAGWLRDGSTRSDGSVEEADLAGGADGEAPSAMFRADVDPPVIQAVWSTPPKRTLAIHESHGWNRSGWRAASLRFRVRGQMRFP